MSNAITYILLIRHGENDWVGQNRLAGRTAGVYLNERGQEQSAQVAQALADHKLSAIYSSPLERCVETAKIVADTQNLPVTVHEGVLEVDYGEWQGGELKELAKTPEWQLVQHTPSVFRFPNGETLFEVQARAVAAIEEIRSQHPDEIVAIFSHGDVIRTAVAHYMGIPIDLFQHVMIGTASVTALAFHGAIPRVLFTNYTSQIPPLEFSEKKDEEKDSDKKHQSNHDGG